MLYMTLPKQQWKKCVKASVSHYWMEQLYEDAKGKSTLQYLNLDHCIQDTPHHIWTSTTSDPLQVHRAAVHVQLLVQRYPISTSHTAKHKSDMCPCCKSAEETLLHFLTCCKALANTRSQHMPAIIAIMKRNNIQTKPETLLQAILDPSKLTSNRDIIAAITLLSRNLCFHLHRQRVSITSRSPCRTTVESQCIRYKEGQQHPNLPGTDY